MASPCSRLNTALPSPYWPALISAMASSVSATLTTANVWPTGSSVAAGGVEGSVEGGGGLDVLPDDRDLGGQRDRSDLGVLPAADPYRLGKLGDLLDEGVVHRL